MVDGTYATFRVVFSLYIAPTGPASGYEEECASLTLEQACAPTRPACDDSGPAQPCCLTLTCSEPGEPVLICRQ